MKISFHSGARVGVENLILVYYPLHIKHFAIVPKLVTMKPKSKLKLAFKMSVHYLIEGRHYLPSNKEVCVPYYSFSYSSLHLTLTCCYSVSLGP